MFRHQLQQKRVQTLETKDLMMVGHLGNKLKILKDVVALVSNVGLSA